MHPSSIKAYIAGIQFHLRCLDPAVCCLFGNPSIRLLFNGFKKERPDSKDKRLPFTLSLIHKMVSHLRQGCFGAYVDLLLETVFLTAFYGFLRCGEFTSNSECFSPNHDLTVSDISINHHSYSIFLKHSKSDRDLRGSSIVISETNTIFCPLLSMTRYLQSRPSVNPDEPLFLTNKGKVMSRYWFSSRLQLLCQRCGLPPHLYTPHSFRIGAATTAAELVPASTLKVLGRWSSSAYERYIHPGLKEIISAQKAMSKSS